MTKPLQEIESTLALLVNSLSVLGPVQFVIQVYSKVFVILDNIHSHTVDGDGCGGRFPPAEIHHQLLSLGGVDMQMVSCTPLDEGFHNTPVLLLLPLTDTANNCRVIRKLLQVAGIRAELNV